MPSLRVVLLPLLLALAALAGRVDAGRLACGVCEALVDEVNAAIDSTTQTHSVQTRFRIDEKKRVPFARTEYNLLEIMEGDKFPKRFEKYGIVKPHTKTSKHMKRAWDLKGEGKEIEPIVGEKVRRPVKKPQPPKPATPAAAAPATDAAPAADAAATVAAAVNEAATASTDAAVPPATDAAATDAAAAAPAADAAAPASDAAPAADAGAAAAAAAAAEADLPELPPLPFDPFRPSGDLPLSLKNNHVYLALSSLQSSTGLRIESGKRIASEIKDQVSEFLEEYLDEAMLMFHRDVPDLKQKLCVEVTEACVAPKRKAKKPAAPAEAKQKDEL